MYPEQVQTSNRTSFLTAVGLTLNQIGTWFWRFFCNMTETLCRSECRLQPICLPSVPVFHIANVATASLFSIGVRSIVVAMNTFRVVIVPATNMTVFMSMNLITLIANLHWHHLGAYVRVQGLEVYRNEASEVASPTSRARGQECLEEAQDQI